MALSPTTSSSIAAVPAPRAATGSPSTAHGTTLVDAPGADVAGLAWIVREITHVPGVLRLHDGRLSFESTRGVLFVGTPAELDLDAPRSSRSGLRLTAGGERLRVCVVRPSGAVAPCGDLVERAAAGRPVTSGEMDSWTVWRPLLAPGQGTGTRPGARVRRALARHAAGWSD
ncbi:hypothetical protein EV188_10496 [Actinomycetospora succinea]|uniref:Uncharacterized protein n=1 Tax=Actinomycetospora succinea TaxID=663603 RepID=A0A4R6V946_9PSEU|nr:hypothetical protein [Actinomycetospora succinea]TDQ58357.1 hypothetical protein EV188_10496 [Actinomycetospora succinea]